MIIYIDSNYICHVEAAAGRRAYETSFFDGKPPAYIEQTRLVPLGESWTAPDGTVVQGFYAGPWQDSRVRDAAQRGYEDALASAAEAYKKGVDSI